MSVTALAWVAGPDTGMSSRAIWAHMMGATPAKEWGGVAYPADPDDFGRCYRLLCLMPEWRARMGEMARYGRVWAALSGAWDELSWLYETEIGSGQDTAHGYFGKSAPMLYERMRALIEAKP